MTDVDVVLRRTVADLVPDASPRDVDRVAVDRVRVDVEGQALEVRAATRGRLLLRLTEATFARSGPPWAGALHLAVTHTGRVRRTGTAVRVLDGGAAAEALGEVLTTDAALRTACLPLDFTRFEVVAEQGHVAATITLMGASLTRMRVPPTSSWVRLHDDQRAALLATFAALDDIWTNATA